ncbi:hypothetical protein GUITHDRAFT_143739 [Guillardia theta CCMP2712]|uniref:Uncharacterized protein n=1 Tax=Guillardia theta (strain CCMP2712) TaxID=905079 RepID=L1ISP7_GUITC|nr:hypothetical protein GUITHDRAFT_143739 [Guillardia theta CCMP2712]EKX39132.1 hypothetical protein GUITHDRAFT_143739 [Guillardia theta CCMP2712]|eukprot:XP_005826112.1 hypothetical protein GUITHDRAFT_143739 [Guillardia theta CCMP2712]
MASDQLIPRGALLLPSLLLLLCVIVTDECRLFKLHSSQRLAKHLVSTRYRPTDGLLATALLPPLVNRLRGAYDHEEDESDFPLTEFKVEDTTIFQRQVLLNFPKTLRLRGQMLLFEGREEEGDQLKLRLAVSPSDTFLSLSTRVVERLREELRKEDPVVVALNDTGGICEDEIFFSLNRMSRFAANSTFADAGVMDGDMLWVHGSEEGEIGVAGEKLELDDSESKRDSADDLGINTTQIRELLLQDDVDVEFRDGSKIPSVNVDLLQSLDDGELGNWTWDEEAHQAGVLYGKTVEGESVRVRERV